MARFALLFPFVIVLIAQSNLRADDAPSAPQVEITLKSDGSLSLDGMAVMPAAAKESLAARLATLEKIGYEAGEITVIMRAAQDASIRAVPRLVADCQEVGFERISLRVYDPGDKRQ